MKLFEYEHKQLRKTSYGMNLESYARSVIYNDGIFKEQLKNPKQQHIRIGATKTIGDYAIDDLVKSCLTNSNIQFELRIDNTENLLKQLKNYELDFLIIEGYFDKTKYDFKLFKKEELIGICSKQHPFANKEITFEELFNEHILLREKGSGTRKVLERFLTEHNYSMSAWKRYSVMNSLHLIQSAVEMNIGISFVYESIPRKNKKIATFRLSNKIMHEFNYVFLKDSIAKELFQSLIGESY